MLDPFPPTPAPNAEAGWLLPRMSACLAAVDQLNEQAFLQIGRGVGDGHRRALALAELVGQALQPGDTETAEQTVARLQLLTERSALWLSEARDRSTMICSILAALDRETESLLLPLRGLVKVVKTLQALRVATRIEAAHSHGHGTLVLGHELQHLGALIQEKLGHITERCDVLATLRQRALALEGQAQAGPLRQADSEIRQARLLLGEVASHCVRTADHTAGFHEYSTELAETFGEMIAALQFQDITRQRLQHIRSALDKLQAALAVSDGEVPAIGDICRLQYDQLSWAADEFCEAVERLDHNLRGMAHGVESLVSKAREVLSAGSSEQCALIAPALQAVIVCLEKVQTINLAAGQAIFAVCQAVRDVADLTGEIERLGEEMQLLAQNAAVSAAHGAARSVGLTVIADNIQALAEEAGRHAAAMAEGCRRVSAQAEELDARDQQSSGGEADLEKLLEEAKNLVERLAGVSASFDAHITAIGESASAIGGEIAAARDCLEIRSRFQTHIEPVLADLTSLAREHGQASVSAEQDAMFASLRQRYTMMSERQIHHRFVHRQAAEPAPDEPSVTGYTVDGLGDNVELF